MCCRQFQCEGNVSTCKETLASERPVRFVDGGGLKMSENEQTEIWTSC